MSRQKVIIIITLIGTVLASGCMNQSWQRGQKHLAHGRYLLALEALEEAQRTKPKLNQNPEFVADLEKVRKECFKIHFQKGLRVGEEKNHDKAILEMERAIELDAGNLNAKAKKKYFEALRFRQRRLLGKAEACLQAALGISPSDLDAKKALEQVAAAQSKAKELYAEGRTKLGERKNEDAVELLERAVALWTDFSDARDALAEAHSSVATEAEGEGLWGLALAHWLRAVDLGSCDEKHQAGFRRAEAGVEREARFTVGVLVVDVGNNATNAQLVERRLLKNIEDHKPPCCQYLGRDELKLSGAQPDYVLKATVQSLIVDASHTTEQRSKQYRVGTKKVFNPEYAEAERQLAEATKEYAEDVQTLERAQREEREGRGGILGSSDEDLGLVFSEWGLSIARSKLNDTPMYIEEPVHTPWYYAIEYHTKAARAAVLYTGTDLMENKAVFTSSVREEEVTQDKTVVNANPDAGVNADPLELPSDNEMKDVVVHRCTSRIQRVATFEFQKQRALHYHKQAVMLQQRGDKQKAADCLVRFLLLAPTTEAKETFEACREMEKLVQVSLKRTYMVGRLSGFAFRVPLQALRSDNDVNYPRGYLGLRVGRKSVSNAPIAYELVVIRVDKNGPAQQAGLRVGDVIVSANGRNVANAQELAEILSKSAGQKVFLRVRRNSNFFEVQPLIHLSQEELIP